MVINLAREIQDKFKAGLSISGIEDGKLQWVGTKKQWEDSEDIVDCFHRCTSNCRRVGCNCECGEWHEEKVEKDPNRPFSKEQLAIIENLKKQDEEERLEALEEAKQEKLQEDHDCTLSEEDGCIGCEKIADRVVHNDDCPLFSDNSGATEGVER